MLHVHLVIQDVILLYRAERAETNVQRNIRGIHSLIGELFKHLVCEVQTCCRRCRRACLTAVDGVVAVVLFQLCGDVGRQRHLTYAVKDIEEIALKIKADYTVALFNSFQYLGGKPLGEIHHCACL